MISSWHLVKSKAIYLVEAEEEVKAANQFSVGSMKWKNVIIRRHLNGGSSVSKRNIAKLYNSENVVK